MLRENKGLAPSTTVKHLGTDVSFMAAVRRLTMAKPGPSTAVFARVDAFA
jgi:hypothetical protein